ncbi:transposase [soil metagenome]
MPRRIRCDDAGFVFHVLNRAAGRSTLFDKDGDYAAFENVLAESVLKVPMRLVSFAIMPNHWHLVAWPRSSGELSEWMQWLTGTHVRRWHAHRHSGGTGPVYQGRFKSFPVQEDDHFYTVCRYVERNPLRAGLVARAEDWRWTSLWHRTNRTSVPWLCDGPLPFPEDWQQRVHEPQTPAEYEALQRCVSRGAPCGNATWTVTTAKTLGLQSALRNRGRPKTENKPT